MEPKQHEDEFGKSAVIGPVQRAKGGGGREGGVGERNELGELQPSESDVDKALEEDGTDES